MSETATGCAIHPEVANPFCRTCCDHGNPHPFERAEKAFKLAQVEKVWARWHEAYEAAHHPDEVRGHG